MPLKALFQQQELVQEDLPQTWVLRNKITQSYQELPSGPKQEILSNLFQSFPILSNLVQSFRIFLSLCQWSANHLICTRYDTKMIQWIMSSILLVAACRLPKPPAWCCCWCTFSDRSWFWRALYVSTLMETEYWKVCRWFQLTLLKSKRILFSFDSCCEINRWNLYASTALNTNYKEAQIIANR